MLIKSLKMENFRQFHGNTVVNFSYDPEKNVTVILGDNTYGKTTILQAFNWCFYGKVVFSHRPDFLLNYDFAASMRRGDECNVLVEVCIIHEGREYLIKRTQKYTCMYEGEVKPAYDTELKVSYKQVDGQEKGVTKENVNKVINNILPESFSEYFFFDTERISSVANRKEVADAVKGLMGITYMTEAISHLGDRSKKNSVIGKLYAAMDIEGDNKANEALKAIHEAEESRKIIKESLLNCSSQINYYEGRKEQLEDILRENQSTTQLQINREKCEKGIKTEEENLSETVSIYLKEFSSNSGLFFAKPLINEAIALLNKVHLDDKGVRDLTQDTIMELIKRGKCICGQCVQEGNEAYKNLINELNYALPESIGSTVSHYREHLNSISSKTESIFNNLEQHYKTIFRSKKSINQLEDQLTELDEQIAGKENMQVYQEELGTVKQRLRELDAKKDSLNREDGGALQEIERNQKIYDSLTSVSEKNLETMRLLSYAEKVRDWFDEKSKEKEINIREELETRVNDIFEKMYHGKSRVAIDAKYNATLMTIVSDREISAGESEGSNRVKNFAFIAGLVSLAREKILSRNRNNDDIELSSEPYPLVMDAPFSNTDETHITNISKVLPEAAEQIIMFVMQKDWNYAEPVMLNHIGQKYYLCKDSETCTHFETRR